MNDGYTDTPHTKGSTATPPPKADHKHEYIRPFYMARIRRFDGTISENSYKFELSVVCTVCDHVKRRARSGTYTEVEVSMKEGRDFREEYRGR